MKLFTKNSIIYFISLFTIINTVSCSSDDESLESIQVTVTASDFTTPMDENPRSGQVIGQIEASTNEGDLSFTITQQQNPVGALAVDATSGELTVADETLFDFEINPSITAVVTVANEGISQNVILEINVQDIFEEKIYEGDLLLVTQKDVEAFAQQEYTQITGSLNIGDYSENNDIYDLSPLQSLTKIDVGLNIFANDLLRNLNGLENLNYIGGNLLIRNNNLLVDIKSLSQLTDIQGNLEMSYNFLLADFTGLHNITTVKGSLSILYYRYSEIKGLSRITAVEEDLILYFNNSLEKPNLNNIKSIGGKLEIRTNYYIFNLDFLTNLEEVDGDLIITGNNRLENLCGLQPLLAANNLNGTYTVADNPYNPSKQDIIEGNCSL
ncbi:hypothetical protein [uncultured Marixanthomonas sp.]|uniref:hypothetical protein n=1 Tax=uncultured Marixanthomonas sp. TaxID=757245 RepID=UPI0030D8F5FF|tara:strand:- start:2036 stop:3184 length:1149 start_codon:yes stop_codon:yes gene_type:complete